MSINSLTVKGIRSFKNLTTINFAVPDGNNEGSGLNMLVGANNSGKSSLIETLFLSNTNSEIIPALTRNSHTKNGVYIKIIESNGNTKEISSLPESPVFIKSSYIDKTGNIIHDNKPLAYILSPKRNIGINLSTHSESRESFLYNNGGQNYRQDNLSNNIGGRFKDIIETHKPIFDYELKKILGYLPDWSLDSDNANDLYIAFKDGNTKHSNAGSGDGFINLFVILTSIYDAPKGSTIIIDEPEISLHPDVQKRLMDRLIFHSRDKQIIISTHSPYFVDLQLLNNGAKLFRFCKENEHTNIYSIKESTISSINSLRNTIEQPYLQDIKSKEIFFLDKLILVEGPDDIYGYTALFEKFNYRTSGHFYGWGVGGADRINHLLTILKDLNYKKVIAIMDNDKSELGIKLSELYPDYKIIVTEAKDIRDKSAPYLDKINALIKKLKLSTDDKKILDSFISAYDKEYTVKGIINNRKTVTINEEYHDNIVKIIDDIKKYFDDDIDSLAEQNFYNSISAIDSEKIARKILDNFSSLHPEKTIRYIESKFLEHTFVSGGGGYDLEKIENNIYYFKMLYSANTASGNGVTVSINISVNIENESVEIISYDEITNTLSV